MWGKKKRADAQQHRVKALVGEVEVLGVPLPDLHIGQIGRHHFPPRLLEHLRGHVHADHVAGGTNGPTRRHGRPARPGGDIQHLRSAAEPDQFHETMSAYAYVALGIVARRYQIVRCQQVLSVSTALRWVNHMMRPSEDCLCRGKGAIWFILHSELRV